MDIRLSSEQQALKDSVVQVVDRLGPRAVAQLDDAERAAKLAAAVAASGWRELRTGSQDGGPLASAVEAAIVAEELARGLADASFLGPVLAGDLRRLAGAPPSDSEETVALSEDLGQAASSAEGAVAIDASGATSALLVGPKGLCSAALGHRAQELDLTRPTWLLDGSGDLTPIGVEPLAPEQLKRWTALGLALVCFDLVGVMRGAIELACEYAKSRRQYGVSVGSFQALQHMLADSYVSMEGSRSIALHAAWSVDALDPEQALAAASMAKAYCARAARGVCEVAIQVHGGIGNTWDCLVHVYLRRALLSIELFGGTGPSLDRVLADQGIGVGNGLR